MGPTCVICGLPYVGIKWACPHGANMGFGWVALFWHKVGLPMMDSMCYMQVVLRGYKVGLPTWFFICHNYVGYLTWV